MIRRLLSLFAVATVALAGLVGIATTETASAASGNPIGSFETVSARFDGDVAVYGWAGTPNPAAGESTVVRVELGSYGSQIGAGATPNQPRPDVAAAFPSVGPSTGWVTGIGEDQMASAHSTIACVTAVTLPSGASRSEERRV